MWAHLAATLHNVFGQVQKFSAHFSFDQAVQSALSGGGKRKIGAKIRPSVKLSTG